MVRAEKFFNEHVASPERRASYHRALQADLTSQATSVAPRTFAEQHLDEGDRSAFLSFLRAGDIPVADFAKDTTLVAKRLEQSEYVLQSGIRVRGTQAAFEEHADIADKDGFLEMLITDRLRSVNGASRRG